jgi:hypothetical protein
MDAPSSSERSAAPEAAGEALDSGGGAAGGFAPAAPNRRIERSISMELESPADELAGLADQVAFLAKMLFTNSFKAACRKASTSRNQVRRAGFPKD